MIDVVTQWATYKNCFLNLNHYVADNSLYVGLWNYEDGPIADLTVCLNDKTLKENQAYIDVNNFPEAIQIINQCKLGEFCGINGTSGYCTYPLVTFDMEMLNKHIEKGE